MKLLQENGASMLSAPFQYFVAVAKYGSFKKAAESLFISQPAVSRQIKILEEKLGYSLFSRTTRRVDLTHEGKVLYNTLLDCDDFLLKAKNQMDALNVGDEVSGVLRIGIHSGWSICLIDHPFLKQFSEKYPNVQQQFVCHGFLKLAEMLQENKLDLIITNANTASLSFDMRSFVFGSYHYKLVLSADHPAITDDRAEMLKRLSGLICYTHSSSLQTTEERQLFLKDAIGIITPIEVVPNMDSVLTAIELKQGFTIMLGCSRMCYLPGIRTFDLDKVTTLYIAHKRDTADKTIEAFINNIILNSG